MDVELVEFAGPLLSWLILGASVRAIAIQFKPRPCHSHFQRCGPPAYITAVPHSKPRFIVLDGGEGCGKSTQIGLLTRRLLDHGISTLCVRDPGATPVSEAIRQILLDPANDDMSMRCEMLLYMAARAQLMAQRIAPALASGQWVVSDRFVSSTLAYQLGGDGLTAEEIMSVARVALAGRLPDLTLILDMPVEQSQARVLPKFQIPLPIEGAAEQAHAETHHGVVKDRIEQRPLDYHRKVRDSFLAQARRDPDHVKIVSAANSQEAVAEDVWRVIRPLLG